jgi:pimeloyl-ACP methyl ester carboxylesterase
MRSQLALAWNFAHDSSVEEQERKKAFRFLLLSEHFGMAYHPTPNPEAIPPNPTAVHDWGAMVAWFFAGAHPDMTQTLTVLSVGHPAALGQAVTTNEDQKARSDYVRLFLMEGKAESVLAADDFRRLRAMFGGKLPNSVVDRFVGSLSRSGRLTAGLNYYRANLSREDWWAGIPANLKITTPTALLWGDQDPALGREQAEKSAEHVDADFRLEVLEGAGHWLQFERSAEVAGFLTGVLSK